MALNSTNKDSFTVDVLEKKHLILVDFWAEWCAPCKAFMPVLERVAQDFSDRIDFYKINIDENPDIAIQYHIRSIPTLKLFKMGKVIETQTSSLTPEDLKNWLQHAL